MDQDVITKTQQSLGGLIASPVLTEKLLQKPPLRFLHDILVAIASQHGLMKGLFDPDEMAWSEAIANDKEAKAFFIAKVAFTTNLLMTYNTVDFNIFASQKCVILFNSILDYKFCQCGGRRRRGNSRRQGLRRPGAGEDQSPVAGYRRTGSAEDRHRRRGAACAGR